MPLTSSQAAIVVADIAANPDLNVYPNTPDGNVEIAKLYNLQASPNYFVWKTKLMPADYRSAITWTDVDSLTASEETRFDWLTSGLTATLNPSLQAVRDGAITVWSPTSDTRAAMTAIMYRLASRIEKLLATNTDTGATGATADTLGFIGPVSMQDITAARSS